MIDLKDCKREKIWRNELKDHNGISVIESYKLGRNIDEDEFMGGPFFKMVYDEGLFQKGGVNYILHHPRLEADDCIALFVKYSLVNHPNSKAWIISSDKDFLQLVKPNVKVFDLKYKEIALNKSSHNNPAMDLFCKIVMGDASDNIPSVLKKCGPVTALKCYQNKEYFEKRLKDEDAYEKYELNRKLIDFDYIPENYKKEFLEI